MAGEDRPMAKEDSESVEDRDDKQWAKDYKGGCLEASQATERPRTRTKKKSGNPSTWPKDRTAGYK